MPNYKASNKMVTIEDYNSPSTAATKTFTFPAIDFSKVSKLVLVIDGLTTAALALRVTINGIVTSKYSYDGRRIAGGTETLLDVTAEEYWEVASVAAIDAARSFMGTIEIYHSTIDKPGLISTVNAASGDKQEQITGFLDQEVLSITSIEIVTSTSTWIADTRMTLYKVLR